MRLNSVALVIVGLASAAFPIHAEQKYTPQVQLGLSGPAMHAPIRLPDYVPVLNYDQFLLASRGGDFADDSELSSATRSAAEALSAKFAMPSEGARMAVAPDPKNADFLDVSSDPKRIVRMAELMQTGDSIIDPAKVARTVMRVETQNTQAPPPTVARRAERASPHVAASRSRLAKRRGYRHQRNRIVSADAAPKSTGISATLDRLVGFGTFAPDHRLTR